MCDTIIFLSSWCNRAIHYILDEAVYICIDAIGLCALHLAWLRLFRPRLLSQVIKIHYSHVYAHTPQTHYTQQTTRFAQPDRSINHRQNHDERLVIEILLRDCNVKYGVRCDANSMKRETRFFTIIWSFYYIIAYAFFDYPK